MTSDPAVIAALQHLTQQDYNKLLLKIVRKFGEHLHNIPDAPSPEDLLLQAIEKFLNGTRSLPPDVGLSTCLFQAVRSDVWNIKEKQKTQCVHFKLRSWSLEYLRDKGIPTAIITQLTGLKDIEFINKSALLKAVKTHIGNDEFKVYQKLIVAYAEETFPEQKTTTSATNLAGQEIDAHNQKQHAENVMLNRIDPSPELGPKIMERVSDDPLLVNIVNIVLDDPDTKAQQMAQALGVEVREIYTAKRRLKDRLRDILH